MKSYGSIEVRYVAISQNFVLLRSGLCTLYQCRNVDPNLFSSVGKYVVQKMFCTEVSMVT